MYHSSPSTVSLNPVFPGHYPATPAKALSTELQELDLHDIAQLQPSAYSPAVTQGDAADERSSPRTFGAADTLKVAYAYNGDSTLAYSDEDSQDDAEEYLSLATPNSFTSTCSISSVEPHSIHESIGEQSDSSTSETSTINRQRSSTHGHDASSVNFRVSDLPSIRSEPSTSFQATDRLARLRNETQCPSSLSLGLELVGLPPLNHAANAGRGVFLDGDSLRYFGVDLSCLSQPDGANAWTLSLGEGSPFPSISTSEETPQSDTSATFSSPNNSTSTNEASSTGSSPSLSLDYYGLESTLPTPAYRSRTPLASVHEIEEPSPPYESATLANPALPRYIEHDLDEPKSHLKEVFGDLKKFGHKLKRIWKVKAPLGLSRPFKAKVSSEPPSESYADTVEHVEVETTIDSARNNYGFRTPPGLSALLYTTEEGDSNIDQEFTPRMAESRRRLFKPKTTAEIKHIRRRTLPAGPLGDASPGGSPMITISQRRPRPRSLIFTMSPDSNSNPTETSISSPRSDLSRMQVPELVENPIPRLAVTTSRSRKRWSTPLSFFSRS